MNKNLKKFGKILKELRIKKEKSLREICKDAGYDPSNWSKIERGVIAPPTDEKTLIKWAKILGLDPKKKNFQDFIDEAMLAQGIIPLDLMSKKNAVKCMPAFFRTLRNEKPTKEEIDRLIELIRNA